jgi:hypothetical protein
MPFATDFPELAVLPQFHDRKLIKNKKLAIFPKVSSGA